jgi:hypothetical protein
MKPKVATDPTPDQLRPLILVETLRKLWLASTCHKITTLWQTHNVLHNSQHAYLRAKGTETALLHICNQLDNARCSFASIYLTQWDIKRAFDSVHPIILKLSWYRLGVPPDVADYLVDLDTQGHTIPRTNAASAAWAANAYANFSADPQGDQLPTFTAERGTGQGDVQSALAWDAFYDILLTALSLLPSDRLYTSTSSNSLTAHNDEAFADDLNSLSPTVAAQQSAADLICAFAIVFGLHIVPDKLKAFAIHNGHTSAPDDELLTLHTYPWSPLSVPITPWHPGDPPLDFKTLGVTKSTDGIDQAQLDLTVNSLTAISTILSARRCSPATKLAVIMSSTISKHIYAAVFTNWSYEYLTKHVDPVLTKLLKNTHHLMQSFPNSFCYLPSTHGGYNLHKFSDLVQLRKASILRRGIDSPHANTRATTDSLINRTFTTLSPPTHSSFGQSLPGHYYLDNPPTPLLFNSLIDFAKAHNLQLVRTGNPAPLLHTPFTHLIADTPPKHKNLTFLHRYNITSPADLLDYDPQNHSPRFHIPRNLSWIEHYLPSLNNIDQPRANWRPGLCILLGDTVHELLGKINSHTFSTHSWSLTTPLCQPRCSHPRLRHPLHFCPQTVQLGAASSTTITIDALNHSQPQNPKTPKPQNPIRRFSKPYNK